MSSASWTTPDREAAWHSGERVTLLTGVTGFLGREVLETLLAKAPEERVLVPVRPSRGRSAEARMDQLLAQLYPDPAERECAAGRVRPLETDLTRDHPLLAEDVARSVAGRPWRLIHGAASVAFDLPLAEARSVNVEGTRRLLGLAEKGAAASNLESFSYVSTSFVAGDRRGTVYEDELEHGQGFTNTYERTKLEAEALVRSYVNRLPVHIFRPSIVAGRSGSGETTSFKVLYWPLKAFARRLVVCIPGDPGACYDIVPVDFVARALLHIAERDDRTGACYHLTAGSTVTLARAVELAADFFGVRRVPPFVSPRRFYSIVRPLLFVSLVGPARRVLKTGDVYIPYLSKQLVFDNRNAAAALEGSGITPPHMEGYLLEIFRYARETDFGARGT